MQTIEYRTVDKSSWPRGEWDLEPDKRQWTDEATGLPCLIVRGPSGALCGYVGVDRQHALYGKDEYAVPCRVEVHGGLTFCGKCQGGDESGVICHRVDDGEDDDVWWLGFDCAHYQDLCPRYPVDYSGTYRNFAYVESEVAALAQQLRDM